MTQSQIKELFGVSSSTLKDWKNNPNHSKYKLGLFLVALDYDDTKKELKKLILRDKKVEIMEYTETGFPCAECGQEYIKTEDGVGGCLNTDCSMAHPQAVEILNDIVEDDVFNVYDE